MIAQNNSTKLTIAFYTLLVYHIIIDHRAIPSASQIAGEILPNESWSSKERGINHGFQVHEFQRQGLLFARECPQIGERQRAAALLLLSNY